MKGLCKRKLDPRLKMERKGTKTGEELRRWEAKFSEGKHDEIYNKNIEKKEIRMENIDECERKMNMNGKMKRREEQ